MAIIATQHCAVMGEFFAFDLETVGPVATPHECHIWDIAVRHMRSGHMIHYTVDPGLPTYAPPPKSDLFVVTKGFLRRSRALPFEKVLPRLVSFVASHCARGDGAVPAVLMSHGTFLLDKPVLEREFARAKETIPSGWYFYDTLPFFRRRYRRQPSYSLNVLYAAVFGKPPDSSHFAVADVITLSQLLMHATGGATHVLTGAYCPPYLSPLQTIKYIGAQKETLLVQHANVTCVEDLVCTLAKVCGFSIDRMARFFEETCLFESSSAMKVARSIHDMLLTCGAPTCTR